MAEKRCKRCREPWPEEELLQTEDTGELVCPECSGLLENEDLGCRYDEIG